MTGARFNSAYLAVAAILAVAAGVAVTVEPILGTAAMFAFVMVLAIWHRPRLGLGLWIASVCFVPYWVGIDVAGFLPIPTLLGLVVVLAVATSSKYVPHVADLVVVALVVVAGAGVFLATSSLPVWFTMISHWAAAYAIARLVAVPAGIRWAENAFAIAFALVAVATTAEWILSWHPFESINLTNPSYETWGPLLERGGSVRSEWAFGHPIALGGALAMSVPFIWAASRFSVATRVIAMSFVGLAVASTQSRGSLIAVGLTLCLLFVFSPRGRRIPKQVLALVVAGGLVAGAIYYGQLTDSAGTEASFSSQYRVSMYRLVDTLSVIGRASSYSVRQDGTVYYERFSSIDNGFLALGLGFGYVAMAVAIGGMTVMVLRVIAREASLAEIALVGNLPVITTVAMITQYQIVVWFMVGLAVATAVAKKRLSPSGQVEGNSAQVDAMSV
ncbi:hypothetical protein HQ308_22175 [Rhodococcus sp. BP-241]|uniref:O-antigen ligase family protein n=1 Tax=Rhodococcus sp. BP-241 TaxID=2739441 RepID=UPI001C9B4796|nr:hypothetical protein [Rhodococcus sp. BP-241]MBY6709503.1 hypothetical protein [Rhodococcus sp. BP-241]